MGFVSAFLQQAEEILDIAAAGDPAAGDLAILMDRQGGMRMLDAKGWSLPALCTEFGATAAYIVLRRAHSIRIEGWGGGERCLLQRDIGPRRMGHLPGMPTFVPSMRGQRAEAKLRYLTA